jgi:hypothetical protein
VTGRGVPRPDPGAVVASVASAVFGSATGASAELLDGDAAIRAAVLHCRRIGFVRLSHGCAASATVAYVTALLAARRCGRVLAVDASGATGPPPAGPPAGPLAGPVTGSGAGRPYVLTLPAPGRPVTVPEWTAAVPRATRSFEVAVTDWGVRHWRDLAAVAGSGHVLCLLTTAERAAAAVAADVATALPSAVPVVVAVIGTPTWRDTLRRNLVEPLAVPAVTVRPRRHRDHVRLAAALMRAAHHHPPQPSPHRSAS